MPSNVNPHCFPPPRTIEEHAESFNVKDATGRTSALRGCPLSGNCGYRLRFERDGSVATDPVRTSPTRVKAAVCWAYLAPYPYDSRLARRDEGRSTPGENDKIVILPTQRRVRTCRFLRRL